MADQELIENVVQRMRQWVYDFGSEKNPQFIDDLKFLLSVVKTDTPYVAPTPVEPGVGWRLLENGEDPKFGDEVRCPSSTWTPLMRDFEPGQRKGWYYRRRIEPQYRPFANAEEYKPHRERWVVNKSTGDIWRATCYSDNADWKGWFGRCEFEDGTPFGVEVTP